MDSDIDDSGHLMDAIDDQFMADQSLPDSDYYNRFDSLMERLSERYPDVKPVVGASGDTSTTDLNSDIIPDVNAIAHNSTTDITGNSGATAAGDCVAQIAGQPVITQSAANVSATDEELMDVKPLITDPSLQSLAATLSTHTDDTDSGEPVMADIPAEVVDSNNQLVCSTDSDATIISEYKNSGEEVTKESIPANIGPQRGRRLARGHYRRRKKRLPEYRSDDSNDLDTTDYSGADSDHSLAPFEGSLRDVSKRMASKTTSRSKTGHRSSTTRSTSIASVTTRSLSLTPRDGDQSDESVPPPLPPQSLLTAPLVSPFPVLSGLTMISSAYTHHSDTDGDSPDTTLSKTSSSKTTTNGSGRTVTYSEKRYKCDECSQTYGSDRELKQHQKSQHGVREPYRCYWDGCDRRYPKESRRAAHIRDKHRTRDHRYRCRYGKCEQWFVSERALNDHRLGAHAVDYPYRCLCQPCDGQNGYQTDDMLSEHQLAVHYPYRCHYKRCDRVYDTADKLRAHRRRCRHRPHSRPTTSKSSHRSMDTTYGRTVCRERDGNRDLLDERIDSAHRPAAGHTVTPDRHRLAERESARNRPIIDTDDEELTDCRTARDQTPAVISHKSMDTSVAAPLETAPNEPQNHKKIKCNEESCSKIFNTKQHLIRHKLTHSGEKPFVCDFNECHKSFTTNSNLLQHKSCVHLNERKFKCNEENCGKKFNTNSDLNKHKSRHSGEKPFVCGVNDCNKRFTQKACLKRHLKTHTKSH